MSQQYPPVTDLLPHRSPILLVDNFTLVDFDNGVAEIRAFTDVKDLFFDVELGGIRPYAAIEIMAQSVGLFASYHNVVRGDGHPLAGKLLSARNFHSNCKALPAPQEWCIRVQEILRTDIIGSFTCTMSAVGGEAFAAVEITVIKEHQA